MGLSGTRPERECCLIISPHSALTALRLPPLSHLVFQGDGKSEPLGFDPSRKSAIPNYSFRGSFCPNTD